MKRLGRQGLSLLLMVSVSLVGILVAPPAAQAAAIAHSFTEVTAPQTTTSASQVDIPGATIASTFFTAGKKYLIVTQAVFNINNINSSGFVRTLHGTTVFDSFGSVMELEPNQTSDYANYGFVDIWTAVSGEGIKMDFAVNAAGNTITVDQITLLAINLSDDLTENTDWLSSEVVATTDLSTAWSTTNNASVTFTPPAGTDWLVLANDNLTGNDGANNFESRINSSGTYTETVPFHSQEGELVSGLWLFFHARVFTALGAVSQTFTEQARVDAGTAVGPRNRSTIIALNLNKFKEHASVWTEALLDVSATNFATQTATVSMTPSVAGDSWAGYAHTFNADATGESARIRLQVDNADQPDTQTSDALLEGSANDATDEMFLYRQSVDSVTAASHTWDVDASCETAAAGRGVRHRSLWAVTMELAGGAPPPAGKPVRPPIVIGAATPRGDILGDPAKNRVRWTRLPGTRLRRAGRMWPAVARWRGGPLSYSERIWTQIKGEPR